VEPTHERLFCRRRIACGVGFRRSDARRRESILLAARVRRTRRTWRSACRRTAKRPTLAARSTLDTRVAASPRWTDGRLDPGPSIGTSFSDGGYRRCGISGALALLLPLALRRATKMRRPSRDAVVVVGSGPIRIGQGIEFDYSLRPRGLGPTRCRPRGVVVKQQSPRPFQRTCRRLGRARVRAGRRGRSAGRVRGHRRFGGHVWPLASDVDQSRRRACDPWRSHHRQRPAPAVDMAEGSRPVRSRASKRLGVGAPSRTCGQELFAKRAPSPREFGLSGVAPSARSYVAGWTWHGDRLQRRATGLVCESAPPILASAPLLVDKYLPGTRSRGRCGLRRNRHPGTRNLRAHRTAPAFIPAIRSACILRRRSTAEMQARIVSVARSIASELRTRGLINIQFVIHDGELYIIEANPRASRTVPIISKATGINLVAAATRVALGESLRDLPFGTGLLPPHAVRRRQSSGLFVCEDERRRDDPRPRNEVHRRSARHRRETFAGALRKDSSPPVCESLNRPKGVRAGASWFRSPIRKKPARSRSFAAYADCGLTLVATDGTHRLLHAAGILVRTHQQDCRGVTECAGRDRYALGRPRHQ